MNGVKTASGLLFFLILFSFLSESYASPRPNVVLIVGDDVNRDEIGAYSKESLTPHLDRLARRATYNGEQPDWPVFQLPKDVEWKQKDPHLTAGFFFDEK